MFSSDLIEGPYTLTCEIADCDDYVYPGSLFSYSFTNGGLFVFNNELYYITTGSSDDLDTGSYRNHELYLYKYNDSDKKFVLHPYPIMTWLQGRTDNYPELPSIAHGNDHIGVIFFHYIEDNKLWFGYDVTTGGYIASYGYIDLAQALQ